MSREKRKEGLFKESTWCGHKHCRDTGVWIRGNFCLFSKVMRFIHIINLR